MGPLTIEFNLDVTVKSKPVLGMDDLLLLNYHWARDTSTFPTEHHRVAFALLLLLLFSTGCRPAELVDAKKKRGQDAAGSDDEDDGEVADEVFGDNDFAADHDADQGSPTNDDLDDAMGTVEPDARRVNALCYEDVRLLAVWNPDGGERDVLAMEVKLAHHKGHNRRPKP
jgi:Protein of unknown function (DUF3435)